MKRIFMAAAVFSLLISATAFAADEKPNPYLKPDETWISISGTAVDPTPSSFILDYGKGSVLVEMDDWDWYKEGAAILEDDKVTVYGRIDDDLFETTSIEANSVYVESLGTYFYASAADEEGGGDYHYWIAGRPIISGQIYLKGKVTGLDDRKFTLDTGARKVTVDTAAMAYNPIDEKGYQWVQKGDDVVVSGHLDSQFWKEREVMADTVIEVVAD